MSNEYESLSRQVRNLKRAVIVMGVVIVVLTLAFCIYNRLDSLRDTRVNYLLNDDIQRLKYELKQVK